MVPLKWTEELLTQTATQIYKLGAKYDALVLQTDPQDMFNSLVALQGQGFALGEGGVVFFDPFIPGINAVVHTYIWDKQWMRRPAIHRSLLQYAFKRYDFKRMTAMIPARNRLAVKNAEAIGFKREGTMRSAVLYNEGMDDCVVLGILPEDF